MKTDIQLHLRLIRKPFLSYYAYAISNIMDQLDWKLSIEKSSSLLIKKQVMTSLCCKSCGQSSDCLTYKNGDYVKSSPTIIKLNDDYMSILPIIKFKYLSQYS